MRQSPEPLPHPGFCSQLALPTSLGQGLLLGRSQPPASLPLGTPSPPLREQLVPAAPGQPESNLEGNG